MHNVIYIPVKNYKIRFHVSLLNVNQDRVSFLTRVLLIGGGWSVAVTTKTILRDSLKKKLHVLSSSVLIYVSPIKGFLWNLKLTHNGTLMYVHSDRYFPNE